MTSNNTNASSEHAFDVDTRVRATGDNRFAATITDRWNALNGGPNGGYGLTVCLQALREKMELPDPLVVSAFFLRPAAIGPAEVVADIIHGGRRLETGQAALIQDGKEAIRITALFTELNEASGPSLILGEKPALSPPDQMLDPVAEISRPDLTLLDRIEYRMHEAPGWLRGEPSGNPSMEFWMRFKDGRDADPLSLPMFVDAFAPAVVEIGALSLTLELTIHIRARPMPGWLACRVSSRHIFGGFHEEDFEIWDSTGKLVAESRQLGLIRA
jgi:acyl-CoA thioesterase